jgi:hypothetical protein
MDFIEELPTSNGFNAILVIVERLTKIGFFIPCNTDITSEGVAKLYLQHIFSKHGIPSDVVSDRGSEFTSHFWRSLGKLLNMNLRLSTAYHPQTDGQTERTNQILETYLRCYINYQQDDWADFLPLAEFAYNNNVSSATQVSPFFANYGYHLRISISLDTSVPSPDAHDFAKSLSELHAYVKEQVKAAQTQYQAASDKLRRDPPAFDVGSQVWLSGKNIKTLRPSKKLGPKRLGPFKILAAVSTHARKLELPASMKRIHPVFHISLLEPFIPNTIPNRIIPPPPPIEIAGEDEYEIGKVLDVQKYYGKWRYLVQWLGYEDTGEPAAWIYYSEMKHAMDVIYDFYRRYPDKKRPRGLKVPPLTEENS